MRHYTTLNFIWQANHAQCDLTTKIAIKVKNIFYNERYVKKRIVMFDIPTNFRKIHDVKND